MLNLAYQRARRITSALAVAAVALSACANAQEDFDRFGGWKAHNFGPGPFFRTHHDGKRWWLVTPEGNAFLSFGANVVRPDGDVERGTGRHPYQENVMAKRGSVEGWMKLTRQRHADWGLNTMGNWSCAELRGELPYTVELGVRPGGWDKDNVPDFFDPEVQRGIFERGANVDAFKDDPYLVGYYLDNELPWGKDWRFFPDLFPAYAAMNASAPGKQRLVQYFQETYGEFGAFRKVWETGADSWETLAAAAPVQPRNRRRALKDMDQFVYLAAREYFRNATEGIRSKDPHHLILGCRFVWVLAPEPVVRACGEFADVLSVNFYEIGLLGKLALAVTGGETMRIKTDKDLAGFHAITGKPLMVTEFSFRGHESNNPNSFPPGIVLQPVVKSQKDRADKFEKYVRLWMQQPCFVGYHWFQWMDQPAAGRGHDGENGNYGLVTIDDEPWTTLVDRVTTVNHDLWHLHGGE